MLYTKKTCEGSPKIDYETANEELEEDAILIEKGEYKCNTGNSTIS